jgi:hypothetical protein
MTTLTLDGLTALPAQVWGGVRLVPLVRDRPITGLRLHQQVYETEAAVIALDARSYYASYIPHGFVATWNGDGTPAAAYGTQLTKDGTTTSVGCMPVRLHRRMARRVDKNRLRFMPLHLAMEGYLALHFGGPTIAWDEFSGQAIRRGLSPREEQAYSGAAVTDLADALRVFEIHPGQCGVLLYVADALAAAFVVPHPDDYRALHPTLLLDMYGEQIYHYAMLAMPVPGFQAAISDTQVRTLADLRAAAGRQQADWAAFHDSTMAAALLEPTYDIRRVYRLGDFTLSRFLPGFRRGEPNHIGELITDRRGTTAYLKTFRLSEKQVRRGHLLNQLAANDWHLADTARAMRVSEAELGMRIQSAGFGVLLRQDVLDGYRAQLRDR